VKVALQPQYAALPADAKAGRNQAKLRAQGAVALMKYGSRIMFFFCGEAVLPSLTVWWNQV
jgi:hypothetical protein